MVYSKIKRILLILLCIFVLFFPFWCVAGLCAETEDVEVTSANLSMNANRNYFASSTAGTIGYFPIEKGYIYHIYNINSYSSRLVAISDEMPDVNVTYNIITSIGPNETFDYISNTNTIMYISYGSSSQAIVTREKLTSMDGAVDDLVNNVGVDSIWNIFDISINYIYIAVLVAFGIFIVSLVIRKITKGKEGF